MRKPTIVAMRGGGFSMEPENPLLDDYVLGRTGKSFPPVCFLPTASGDADGYVEGGNTANLLAVWRVHGLDRILQRAWSEGIVLCGLSAGAPGGARWRLGGRRRRRPALRGDGVGRRGVVPRRRCSLAASGLRERSVIATAILAGEDGPDYHAGWLG